MIRIMHVVDNMGKGGLENGLANLIERMDSNRFEHVVFAIRRLGLNADRLSHCRVQFKCLEKKESDSAIQLTTLARAIREANPDVVHSRNWAAIEAVVAGRWVRFPALLHSEHGLNADESAGEPRRRTWFRRLAFEIADQVLCVSHQLSQVHAARTGFPIAKMTVIHNGVDTKRFFSNPAARIQIRTELGIPPDGFCIGCVGNLTAVKDYASTLQAVKEFAGDCSAWRLVIIGDGPERRALESFVNGHPEWSRQVSFQGLSDRVPEMLNAFDVYVLSSLTEGISNSLLEAMATGLPVIATETGGNPEVIVKGQSGLLFPVRGVEELRDCLRSLHRQQELRVRLGAGALRRVQEEFSIDTMVQKYEQAYMHLAELR